MKYVNVSSDREYGLLYTKSSAKLECFNNMRNTAGIGNFQNVYTEAPLFIGYLMCYTAYTVLPTLEVVCNVAHKNKRYKTFAISNLTNSRSSDIADTELFSESSDRSKILIIISINVLRSLIKPLIQNAMFPGEEEAKKIKKSLNEFYQKLRQQNISSPSATANSVIEICKTGNKVLLSIQEKEEILISAGVMKGYMDEIINIATTAISSGKDAIDVKEVLRFSQKLINGFVIKMKNVEKAQIQQDR